MQRIWFGISMVLSTFVFQSVLVAADVGRDPSRVYEPGQLPKGKLLGAIRTLNDKYHPWKPAETKEAWEAQARAIREQVLVSTGLWPMPPKAELKPVIHGKIDRGEYTIEKVYFASHPGHYVTGNLYRPTKKVDGKRPGVLCPHGHWANGRFYDAGEENGRKQIDSGAERDMSGGRYPVQARMAQLARMGCVVFHYDMVGMADSKQIGHSAGFRDAEAGLRLQNFLGLQTFNSIRALDFLMSLPEVDPERIGVTGSSGGGTQTFMLCAIDPRPKVAFPAVMVSTAMQGGCICENAELLRIGINNVAIAALFAPKPMAMSGADDWTIDFETKGLPELKQVYGLYGQADLVQGKVFPQFGHNYNRVAREMMYNWFNAHLNLGYTTPISEEDFWPVDPKDLSVFDADHRLPEDAVPAEGLREYLTEVSAKEYESLIPANKEQAAEYHRVVGTAARVMLDDGVPPEDDLIADGKNELLDGVHLAKGYAGRRSAKERCLFVGLTPEKFTGDVVLWIDPRGKQALFGDDGKPTSAVQRLLNAGKGVFSADVHLAGEFVDGSDAATRMKVNKDYQGYTYGYNRTVIAERVRDILTTLAVINQSRKERSVTSITLVGTGDAGPWVMLAAGLAGERVKQTIADARGFSFSKLTATDDPMYLPGSLKYGGLPGLTALAAPNTLTVAGMKGISETERKPLLAVYKAGGGQLTIEDEPLTPEKIVDRILQSSN